jgi:hypothetical protein
VNQPYIDRDAVLPVPDDSFTIRYTPEPNPVRRVLGNLFMRCGDIGYALGLRVSRARIDVDGLDLRPGPPLYEGERCEKCGGDHFAD